MAEYRLVAKFVWKPAVILERAVAAAAAMGLTAKTTGERQFRAGSRWWRSFELDVAVEPHFTTHLVVVGRSLKVGYETELQHACELFAGLVRHPTADAEPAPAADHGNVADEADATRERWLDRSDWTTHPRTGQRVEILPLEPPEDPQAVVKVELVAAAADALLDPESFVRHSLWPAGTEHWGYAQRVGYLEAVWHPYMHLRVVQERMSRAVTILREQYARSQNFPV
jgi:hypothetical protein